jgi:predicted metal-dependent phosphoesterase TrpH
VLKAELHTHTADDPHDAIPYSGRQLVDRAAELGYGVLAVTLHDRQYDARRLAGYARERGIVLIPGIERTIAGKHVLLLNFPEAVERATSFDEIGRLKRQSNGIVIAPHPFFPTSTCLRGALDRRADLFDAVEINAFYTRRVDFNAPAIEWARARGLPLVGNGDVHRLGQLGTTFSLIDAEPDANAIVEAIRDRRVCVETAPISTARAAAILMSMMGGDVYGAARRWARGERRSRETSVHASAPHASPMSAPTPTSNG